MNFQRLKKQLLVVFIAYILFDIIIVGSFLVVSNGIGKDLDFLDRMSKIFELYPSTLINPFNVIYQLIVTEGLFGKFMNSSFWTLIIFAAGYIYWLIKNGFKTEYQGIEHGSSDWSKNGEEFFKLADGSEILNKKMGFILSKKHYLGTDLSRVKINKNILVFGGSGTGKSACYIKPNILQLLGSYVITDPKGELYRETSQFLKANGYKIKTLNLVEQECSDRYNPIAHIRDHQDVHIIAHTIVKGSNQDGQHSSDPFWDDTAVMLLKACIYYVISVLPEEEQNLSSCLNIVRAGGANEDIFDKLFSELKPDNPGRKEYEGIRVGADKTKQSIAISLVSKLTHFDDTSIQRITTSNDIFFEELGERKVALFVITPPEHSAYDYILTIFFSQLLHVLYAQANKNRGTLKNQVYLLLDEFANIGQIPDFNKILSTTRSLGISVSVVVQSLDQLESLYKDTYENIIGNCDTQVFLGSKSIKTCEYVSKSLGQKTIKYQNRSVSKDKEEVQKQGVSFSEQKQGRELMTTDELMRLNYDKEIILVRGLKPILAKKAWYFKYHKYRKDIGQYFTDVKKTRELPIRVMNVPEYIENKEREIKSRLIEKKLVQDSVGEADVKETNNVEEESQIEFDLQKELEKKFDELFGAS